MPHRNIANWTMIRNMCRRCFAGQTAEEEMAVFEREGEVAQVVLEAVMEEAPMVDVDVTVGKMHAAAARKAVEATMAALCAIRNDVAMVSLEAVDKEATKVAVHELHDGVIAC
jgi:hypothetical protein